MAIAPDQPEILEAHPRARLALAMVAVKQLHGRFSYEIDLARSGRVLDEPATDGMFAVSEERLTLLYGNNGTGKTTLLRLLFHALSSAGHQGHRTALFNARFERLDVRLTDRTRISYIRPDGEIAGPYRAELERPGGEGLIAWDYSAEEPFGRRYPPEEHITWPSTRPGLIGSTVMVNYAEPDPSERFLEGLADLQLNPVLLGDSRAITADVLEDDPTPGRKSRDALRARARRGLDVEELVAQLRDVDVDDALLRVRGYLSQLAFTGAQAGSQRVDSVYLNVADAIVQHASKVGRPSQKLLPELQLRVTELGRRAQRFNAYGLLPEFPTAALEAQLAEATDKNGPLLLQVLSPYLDGLEQRMDALEPGLRAVAPFIDALNSFLENKEADFRPGREGIRIRDRYTQEQLDAFQLSSGEKQIVLLFSDIVALQGQTRVFIIDEPELSLNPEWQRKLMPSLLEVTQESEMQLLAATHSIEIMARYRDRIRHLSG